MANAALISPIRRPKEKVQEMAKSFVAKIVENSNINNIKPNNESGKGSGKTAKVVLPIAKGTPEAKNAPKKPTTEKAKGGGNGASVSTAAPKIATPDVTSNNQAKAKAAPVAPQNTPKKAAAVAQQPANQPGTKSKAGKPAKNTPAQTISDEAAWEEIGPMMSDLLAEECKVGVNVNQQEVFRSRCENGPFAAVVKGHFLTTLKLRNDTVKDLAQRSLAVSTVKAHKRMLKFLISLPAKYHQLNLDRAMEQYFLDSKARKRWLPTTMVVKLATAHGALRLLPLYAEGELPVLMRESVLWMSAMKAAAKMAKQHPPTQPTAATWKEVEEAINKETIVAVRMAVLLTWLTCGRGGDVLLLKPDNVELTMRKTPGGEVPIMSVGFWKGKTVKTRGSYTVFTQQPPPALLEEWKAYHKSVKAGDYLFKGVRGSQIKDALRRANAKLEQRSMRRGAIQALAATGLKDEELLHYSGHTNVIMLRRYLNFGKVSGEGPRLAVQASALVQ